MSSKFYAIEKKLVRCGAAPIVAVDHARYLTDDQVMRIEELVSIGVSYAAAYTESKSRRN